MKDLRQELHKYIDSEDEDFVRTLHEMATVYLKQSQRDKMIAEAEEDIEAGRIYSQEEIDEYIKNWKA